MNPLIANVMAVGAGSCLGGMARYLVSRLTQSYLHGEFPWGTFVVNVAGCFIIGLIYGFIDRGFHLGESMRLFITVGFCGGFTTFSTFINESYQLFNGSGHQLTMILYATASIAAGFIMLYAAHSLTRLAA